MKQIIRKRSLTLMAVLSISSSGCAPGFIYTNIHEPLSTDMQMTPSEGKTVEINNNQIRIPLGLRASVSTQWRSGLLGETAKEQGLTKLYYADLHLVSVLGGIWQRAEITVVGE